MSADEQLVKAIRTGLAGLADPVKAPAMQAYMKSAMPFRGVAKPERSVLLKRVLADHILPDRVTYSATVLELWRTAEFREERYAAIELSGHRAYRRWQDPELVPMYEEMIVSGAWWDYVDELAIRRVGPILRADRARVTPMMLGWAADRDLLAPPHGDHLPDRRQGGHRHRPAHPRDRAGDRRAGVLPAQGNRLGPARLREDGAGLGAVLRGRSPRAVRAVPAGGAQAHRLRSWRANADGLAYLGGRLAYREGRLAYLGESARVPGRSTRVLKGRLAYLGSRLTYLESRLGAGRSAGERDWGWRAARLARSSACLAAGAGRWGGEWAKGAAVATGGCGNSVGLGRSVWLICAGTPRGAGFPAPLDGIPRRRPGAQGCVEALARRRHCRVAGLGGLVDRQRPVRRAEAQLVRQRALALADLLARVHVEQRDVLEQLARAVAQDRRQVRRRHVRRRDQGHVQQHRRVRRTRSAPGGSPGAGSRRGPAPSRPSAAAGRAPRPPWGAARPRGRPASRRPAAGRSGPGATAAGRRPAPSARSRRPRRPCGRPATASAQFAGSPWPHQPARWRWPASTTATCSGCCGTAASSSASSSSEGRRSTPRSGTFSGFGAGSTTWPMWYSETSFIPRDTLRCSVSSRPGSSVVASRLRSASSGLRTTTVLRRTSSAGRPKASHTASPMNGNGSTSTYPASASARETAAAAPLAVGQAAAGRGGGQRRRDAVVALQPQHLFDEVGGLAQVAAPARRDRRDQAGAVVARADRDLAADLGAAAATVTPRW